MAVTGHLASFAFLLGLVLSFAAREGVPLRPVFRKSAWAGTLAGLLLGCISFGVRAWDPRGTNVMMIAFNRWLVVAIAAIALLAALLLCVGLMTGRTGGTCRAVILTVLAVLLADSLMVLTPPALQFTREFVYFGESGISTNTLLRALGFTLGLAVCLLLCLSAYRTHQALSERGSLLFLFGSVLIFAAEYGTRAVSALQRLKVIRLSDAVFQIMIWRDANPNAFLFAQLALGLVMLAWVVATHRRPEGEYPNKAALRKERARLRDCRRWAWSLCAWGITAVFTVVVLHWYDTRPPAEVQPEPYALADGVLSIELEKVSDGHLHKFSYVTPNKIDVRFLVVKKPVGTAYGVGLDACDICGPAGYYERGDEVVCRRCDVVMNKNTIGFKGGCNPVPFAYEIREGKIFINAEELTAHEKRFK